MGLSRRYWKARSLYNAGGALFTATILTFGQSWGLPKVFRYDFLTFNKSMELMLTVGSSLLGFIIAAVTLIYALVTNERFSLLRQSRSFSELAAASRASISWLLITSVGGAILLMLNVNAFAIASRFLIFLTIFITFEAFASTAALAWIISRLISIV